jgi:hypothetical protein
MSLVMYFGAPVLTGDPMDVALMLAGILGTSWAVGMIVHALLGIIVFPTAYAMAFGWFRGRPWIRGLLFGTGLWFLAEVAVVPVAGGGFFHSQMGGVAAVIVSLLGHMAYGTILGWIAGPGVESRAAREETTDPYSRPSTLKESMS